MDRRLFLTGLFGLAGTAALASVHGRAQAAVINPGSGILDELDASAPETLEVQDRRWDRHGREDWRRRHGHPRRDGWRRHHRPHRRWAWRRVCRRVRAEGRWRRRCWRERVLIWT